MNNPIDLRLETVHRFFSGTGRTYDAMVHYATFGIDSRWKRGIVDLLPPHPARVLDLACGTGISTVAIAQRHPGCQIAGVELREEYLEIARRKIQQIGLINIEFVLHRAEDYRCTEPFDCVVSSYLAKYADLRRLIPNMKTMRKDGGLFLMHDFTYPPNRYLAEVWHLYSWVLQHLGSRLFPAWRAIYEGLPRLIQDTCWVPELIRVLNESGFQDIQLEYLTAYGSAIVTARKDRR